MDNVKTDEEQAMQFNMSAELITCARELYGITIVNAGKMGGMQSIDVMQNGCRILTRATTREANAFLRGFLHGRVSK